MFFKKFFVLLLLFFPFFSSANFFGEFTCIKEMKAFYPRFLKGTLPWSKQKRFFRCLKDALELVVDKQVFTHDQSRDYFKKIEIFRMFHIYFEYDKEWSHQLTNTIFFIKKALLGGSIDKLKDKELLDFYRLVDDYREVYFILHKTFPVFLKIFSENSRETLFHEEAYKALSQVKKAMVFLNKAYQREEIFYTIEDLYKYPEYLLEARLIENKSYPKVQKIFSYLHHVLAGSFSSEKAIWGEHWSLALKLLYQNLDLMVYYKSQFHKHMASDVYIYRFLTVVEKFISMLKLVNPKGFPLNNLDEILKTLLSFVSKNNSFLFDNILANLEKENVIPLMTRQLTCYSLSRPGSKKSCQTKWGKEIHSLVNISFKDFEFVIFPNRIEKKSSSKFSRFFINIKKLNRLKNWVSDYKQAVLKSYTGHIDQVSKSYLFEHWMDSFFGWDEQSSRIIFGSFSDENQQKKGTQILHYRFFLNLLFKAHMPRGFFSKDMEKPSSISLLDWRNIGDQILPTLFVLGSVGEYDRLWRHSFFEAFSFADSFLYSSNQDELLNPKELVDLIIHIFEGLKTESMFLKAVSDLCGDKKNMDCVSNVLTSDTLALSVYPRFQRQLYGKKEKYVQKIKGILELDTNSKNQKPKLLPLFLMIQAMDSVYAKADRNRSSLLESDEILFLVKNFEEQIVRKVPYILSKKQARAYLLYGFKTGYIPFFTGAKWMDLEFTNWYLNEERHENFKVNLNDFHHLVFDWYKIYKTY